MPSKGSTPDDPRDAASSWTADIHRGSHGDLVRNIDVPQLGAIIVLAARSTAKGLTPGLKLALQLSAPHGAPVIVLCSGEARPDEIDLSNAAPDSRAVDFPEVVRRTPWMLETDQHAFGQLRPQNIAHKRNFGLALAVMAGWESVLFLDDDVSPSTGRTLTISSLTVALCRLASHDVAAIGWPSLDYPDNSVFCHARRLAGLDQDVFIGTGALLVEVDVDLPFFPASTYNEDWLFLIALAAGRGCADVRRYLGSMGAVQQLPYDPFQPARARSEEAGDILAEVMMNLLEDHGPRLWDEASDPERWASALSRRKQALMETISRLTAVKKKSRRVRFAAKSLIAARRVHAQVRAEDFQKFVEAWRNDLVEWRGYLEDLELERAQGATWQALLTSELEVLGDDDA